MPATATIREYNPATGAFIGNVNTVAVGQLAAGMHSRIKVYDIAFNGVEYATSVRIGLTNSAGIVVNPTPLNVTADGSASNGNFGIMSSEVFDPTLTASPLTRHFAGLNTIGANDPNNVVIGSRDATTSRFFYIDVQPGSNNLGELAPQWVVYFDAT